MDLDTKYKKMGWTVIPFIKLSVFAFTLMIAKLWKPILSLDWYWYLIVSVLAGIQPVYKAFRK